MHIPAAMKASLGIVVAASIAVLAGAAAEARGILTYKKQASRLGRPAGSWKLLAVPRIGKPPRYGTDADPPGHAAGSSSIPNE